MLQFIYHALRFFRPVFSRERTWLYFCMVLLGFLASSQIESITSFCRFWGVGASHYYAFLHFFHSTAYSLGQLVFYWGSFVLRQKQTIFVGSRALLLGDHFYTPKDGRKMPAVVTLRQNSQTQSKPSRFRGHCWGILAVVVGSFTAPFSLPLALSLHQGFVHLGQQDKSKRKTLHTRMMEMVLTFSYTHNLPCLLVLDAFFPVASVFTMAASFWSCSLKQPFIHLIIRAKKSYVAYFEASPSPEDSVGRKPLYGERVKLYEVFDQTHLFSKVKARIYGKEEEILLMAADLLWKPTAGLIRFVFARTSRGPIVLMCSDLAQDPLLAIECYCLRVRIELMIDLLKNLLGVFRYHFWSPSMPRHSRSPKSNKLLKEPTQEAVEKVRLCWDAIERFAQIGAISLGLLQLLSLRFPSSIWAQFTAYLRTRSRELPSERVVKWVLSPLLVKEFLYLASDGIMQQIRALLKKTPKDSLDPPEEEEPIPKQASLL